MRAISRSPVLLGLIFIGIACAQRPKSDRYPNDTDYQRQWNLQRIDLPAAWDITKGSSAVTIAVIDRGFALSQVELAGEMGECRSRFLPVVDFSGGKHPSLSETAHGTAILSVLGSCTDNNLLLTGVDWNARILPVIWGDKSTDELAKPIMWSANLAKVLNFSFNDPSFELGHPQSGQSESIWHRVVEQVNQKGGILVVAAGNEDRQIDFFDLFGGFEGVISVGAVSADGNLTSFSNWGPLVTTLAPGVDILGVAINQKIGGRGVILFEGTSMAAPQVSGVVSLMASVYSDLNWKTAKYFLQRSNKPLSCDEYCSEKSSSNPSCETACCDEFGRSLCAGVIDAGAAVALAKQCGDEAAALCVQVGRARVPSQPLIDAKNYAYFVSSNEVFDVLLSNVGGSPAMVAVESNDYDVALDSSHNDVSERVIAPGALKKFRIKIAQTNASRPYGIVRILARYATGEKMGKVADSLRLSIIFR